MSKQALCTTTVLCKYTGPNREPFGSPFTETICRHFVSLCHTLPAPFHSLHSPPIPPKPLIHVSLHYCESEQSRAWQQFKFWSKWFLSQTIRLVKMFHVPQKTTNYPISLYVPLLRWLWFTSFLFSSLCNTDLIVFHVCISLIFAYSSFSFGPFMSWLYSGLMMHIWWHVKEFLCRISKATKQLFNVTYICLDRVFVRAARLSLIRVSGVNLLLVPTVMASVIWRHWQSFHFFVSGHYDMILSNAKTFKKCNHSSLQQFAALTLPNSSIWPWIDKYVWIYTVYIVD